MSEKEQVTSEFDDICKKVKDNLKFASDAELLELYALYKQATAGDNDTKCPSMFHYKDRQKWNAWVNKKGTDKSVATDEYTKYARTLLDKQEKEQEEKK